MDKEYCVGFMQGAVDGQEATQQDKEKFVASLKAAHAEGFYLAFGNKNGWKLSNKKPESLANQIRDIDHLINSLFEWVPEI